MPVLCMVFFSLFLSKRLNSPYVKVSACAVFFPFCHWDVVEWLLCLQGSLEFASPLQCVATCAHMHQKYCFKFDQTEWRVELNCLCHRWRLMSNYDFFKHVWLGNHCSLCCTVSFSAGHCGGLLKHTRQHQQSAALPLRLCRKHLNYVTS